MPKTSKRQFLIGFLATAGLVALYFLATAPPKPSPVEISFLSYTNIAKVPCAIFSVTNTSTETIRVAGHTSRRKPGGPPNEFYQFSYRTPTGWFEGVDATLPPKQAVQVLVPLPPEPIRWRLVLYLSPRRSRLNKIKDAAGAFLLDHNIPGASAILPAPELVIGPELDTATEPSN